MILFLPSNIDYIISQYLFNYCYECNNKYTSWDEKMEIKTYHVIFFCTHCKLHNNFKKNKIKKLFP